MDHHVLDDADTSYLDRMLLKDGEVQIFPADSLEHVNPDHIKLFCLKNALYQLPTVELIWWLKRKIDGRKAIEICAGRSALGRFLDIPMVDNYSQTRADVATYMEFFKQPAIKPLGCVKRMDAIEAVLHYKPEVVIGSFVTQKFVEGDKAGNIHGPDEALILLHADYIHVGNLGPHGDKRILASPHEVFYAPWLISRAFKPENNRIWSWKQQVFNYPQLDRNLAVGIPKDAPGFVPPANRFLVRCQWCMQEIYIGPKIEELMAQQPLTLLCPMCIMAKWGPDVMTYISGLGND